MSYSADRCNGMREVAEYVGKISSGAKPADLPVQQPTKFELTVNMKTAKSLGITFPQTILIRADRINRVDATKGGYLGNFVRLCR